MHQSITEVQCDLEDTIILNVGGVKHETRRSTLEKWPLTTLADNTILQRHFRPKSGDFYFDRHPGIFTAILNYYRIGTLHLPPDACAVMVKEELDFWGIADIEIDNCCWVRYHMQWDSKEALESVEARGRTKRLQNEALLTASIAHPSSCWSQCQVRMWRILDEPLSSWIAKIYAVISISAVLLSIFTFCAETHPGLKSNMTVKHYAELHGVSLREIINDWQFDWLFDKYAYIFPVEETEEGSGGGVNDEEYTPTRQKRESDQQDARLNISGRTHSGILNKGINVLEQLILKIRNDTRYHAPYYDYEIAESYEGENVLEGYETINRY